MSEFMHSIVLFSGDDGLPLEFNIQYVSNKANLKAVIEYGGGLCTLSDSAIYLVSPGTRVVNVNPNKKMISTKYIYDCVKENFLLETDEYRFEINEMETSDISDNSANLIGNQRKSSDDIADNSIDLIDADKSASPNLFTLPKSNHDFDFEDTECRSYPYAANERNDPVCQRVTFPSPIFTKNVASIAPEQEKKKADSDVSAVPDSLEDLSELAPNSQNLIDSDHNYENVMKSTDCVLGVSYDKALNSVRNSPISAVIVSSSQPCVDGLDKFDNMILNKVQENRLQEDEGSQSYTVSSSADAQVSPKVPPHNISSEIFDGSAAAPDSASQFEERQQYIKELEAEIEEILKKPSPKSIQDKIVLVKYICIVKKLPPAIVLQTLQRF